MLDFEEFRSARIAKACKNLPKPDRFDSQASSWVKQAKIREMIEQVEEDILDEWWNYVECRQEDFARGCWE